MLVWRRALVGFGVLQDSQSAGGDSVIECDDGSPAPKASLTARPGAACGSGASLVLTHTFRRWMAFVRPTETGDQVLASYAYALTRLLALDWLFAGTLNRSSGILRFGLLASARLALADTNHKTSLNRNPKRPTTGKQASTKG
jgi:hypothetical protein